MFEGPIGKQMMIDQGYVPQTCTLPDEVAGPLIWQETNVGRLTCWICHHDRSICKGKPYRGEIGSLYGPHEPRR